MILLSSMYSVIEQDETRAKYITLLANFFIHWLKDEANLKTKDIVADTCINRNFFSTGKDLPFNHACQIVMKYKRRRPTLIKRFDKWYNKNH